MLSAAHAMTQTLAAVGLRIGAHYSKPWPGVRPSRELVEQRGWAATTSGAAPSLLVFRHMNGAQRSSAWMIRIGWVLTFLSAAYMMLDGMGKFLAPPQPLSEFQRLGEREITMIPLTSLPPRPQGRHQHFFPPPYLSPVNAADTVDPTRRRTGRGVHGQTCDNSLRPVPSGTQKGALRSSRLLPLSMPSGSPHRDS